MMRHNRSHPITRPLSGLAFALADLLASALPNIFAGNVRFRKAGTNAFIMRFSRPNFLRRAEGASAAYKEARRLLLEHLATPRNIISPYFRALTQFEICISQCYQGYELWARAFGQQLYEPGRGTPEEKLQVAYVDSKHMDRMIHGEKLPDTATSGIWIVNTGIESSRGLISFHELHDLLHGMHSLAEKLCAVQTPPPAEPAQ